MHLDLTVPSYLILGIVAYYAALFVLSAWRRAPSPLPDDRGPLFVIVVPARNEDAVLTGTLANLACLEPRARCRVLVMNDGSSDETAAIADAAAEIDQRIRAVHRATHEAGRGKSDVLNAAYRTISDLIDRQDPWLQGYGRSEVVLAIVDADGRLDENCLRAVTPYFDDADVASVQVGVRIGNANRSELARMQDMEFVGFSWLVQIARDHIGSSGLGGNGQFTTVAALDTLAPQPWTPGALTEDLDLGLRLILSGWRTRFCHATAVTQQGLESWRPLLRQRTRWIQGHYQCWRHIGGLLKARRARLATRLDLLTYLVLVVTVLLVSATMITAVLSYAGVVEVSNRFLDFVPAGLSRRVTSLVLSLLPVCLFMLTYQRHSANRFRWYEVPAYAVIFTLYTYVWLITTIRALFRIATRRRTWVKTPRVAVAEASA